MPPVLRIGRGGGDVVAIFDIVARHADPRKHILQTPPPRERRVTVLWALAHARANMTDMSDHPVPARKPSLEPGKIEGLSPDAFFYENELSRKRSEARKRAIKQWLHRLLKRSPSTQATDLD